MKQQTAIQELFEKYGHLLPDVKEEYFLKERQQHGDTWDEAIMQNHKRGNVISRSLCDFDDYFSDKYFKTT
jgi:hypothetical protein